MSAKKPFNASFSVLAITLFVGGGMAFVPSADAESTCQGVGDPDSSWVVVQVCIPELVDRTEVVPTARVEPQFTQACPIECVPIPVNVHEWVVPEERSVTIKERAEDRTGADVYWDRIDEAVCAPYPPGCETVDDYVAFVEDIINNGPPYTVDDVIEIVTGQVDWAVGVVMEGVNMVIGYILPASSNGHTIDGVVVETLDGSTIYIGFGTIQY